MAREEDATYLEPDMELMPSKHQFGGQGTLFDAPLGQPDAGVFKGNPNARIYRAMSIPNKVRGAGNILEHVSQPRPAGRETQSLGIHWQHSLDYAQDIGEQSTHAWGNGEKSVIIEADHPGHEHVVDHERPAELGPPDDAREPHHKQSQATRDWKTIQTTVGPQNMLRGMLAEVPVRPGAPMNVTAVHVQHPERGWVRHPVQFAGSA